ncbi:hypothetical protein Gotur_024100 [Gossypium turneri]
MQLFYDNYGDLPYLLDVKVDKYLFRALAHFWNPAYSCQLPHVWECRFGTYDRRICGFTPMFKVSSG